MKRFLLLMGLVIGYFQVQAQQKGLNYQAVILDPNPIQIPGTVITGQALANGKVWIRFTLISPQGVDYEEVQSTTTDAFGLVNLTIGGASASKIGSNVSGAARYTNFDAIVWDSALKMLKVGVSFTTGNTFNDVSTQQLSFTPYALYAASVDYKNVRDAPKNLSQFANDVGYLVPKDIEPLKRDILGNTISIQENATKLELGQQENKTLFLLVNQSIKDINTQVSGNTTSIIRMGATLADHEARISTNTSQIANTNASLSSQLANLQGQTAALASVAGSYEVLGNKSAAIDLGNSQPSNTYYPTQMAVKSYVDNRLTQVLASGTPDATSLATGKLQLAGDLGGTATSPTVPGLLGKENLANKSSDVTLDGWSDAKYPSVKAVKDYVDVATTGVVFQATLASKANLNSPIFLGTPELPIATQAVTQSVGNRSNLVATTAFVSSAIAQIIVGDADANTKGILQLSGDLGGTAASPSIAKIKGIPVSSTAPTLGQVLKFDGASYVPNSSVSVETQTLTLSGSTITLSGTSSAVTIPDADANTKGILQLTGDLGGTAASPTIAKIKGIPVSSTAPTIGQVLKYDGTSYVPNSSVSAETQTLSLSGSTITLSGTNSSITLPAVVDADASTKGILQLTGDLGGTAASPSIAKINGIPVSSTAPTVGQVLKFDGTSYVPNSSVSAETQTLSLSGSTITLSGTSSSITLPAVVDADASTKGILQLSGDLGGTAASPTIAKINGIPVSSTAPIIGQVLKFDGTSYVPNSSVSAETQTLSLSGSTITLSGTSSAVTIPDADANTKGILQLTGDLGGTAASPSIADGAITTSKLATASVTNAKIFGPITIINGGTGSATQNFVDLNSSQIVAGDKTFSGNIVVGTSLELTGNLAVNLNKFTVAAASGNTLIAGSLSAGGIVYPITNGTLGQVLTTNGSGLATWSGISSSALSGIIPVSNGGTGVNTLTGLVKGNGTSPFTAAVVGTDYSLVRETSDEFAVTIAGQTTFTLSRTPIGASMVRLFINGVRISKNAISSSGTTATYTPSNNGSASLLVNDRIQIDYYY